MKEKVVLIGAGSAMFTRGLVADLIRRDWQAELALVDIDPDALAVAEALVGKMLQAKGSPITLTASTERRDVLPGARIVPNATGSTASQDPKVEPASTAGASSVPTQKFDGCDTCHIDSADEVAASCHCAKGIGCVKCHGPSIAHVRDENNEVEPDRVFSRKNTDALCSVCHECPRPGAPRPPATPGPDHKICTDCHGAHKTVRQLKTSRS